MESGRTGVGWLGLEELTDGDVDFASMWTLGDAPICVSAAPGGPAYRAGIRTRDFLIKVNGLTWDEYHDTHPPIGEHAILEVHREGLGKLLFDCLHEPWPSSKPPRVRKQTNQLCGLEVANNDRIKWHTAILENPKLSNQAKVVAGLIALKYHNRKTGEAFPAHATLASNCGCSISSIQRAIAELHGNGVLRIVSGSKSGGSNRYRICHAARPSLNVIPIQHNVS